MDDRKLKLLKSLDKEFQEADSIGEASIFSAEELDAPSDILRAEIAEFGTAGVSVLGEFFFMPFEDTEVLYFSSVITISGSITEDIAPELAQAAARLNYYLPCGCFALGDHDTNLVYRLTIPVIGDWEQKKQEQIVSVAAADAIMTAEKYEAYLHLLIDNEVTVDEMIEMITPGK